MGVTGLGDELNEGGSVSAAYGSVDDPERALGARTPVLEALHLWALLAYTAVTWSLALTSYVCARQLQRAHDREARREAAEADRGEYAPWERVGSSTNGSDDRPWRPRWAAGLRVAAYLFCWWSLSVSFTLVNKYFLNYWRPTARPGMYVAPGFPFAVTTTTMHLTMKVLLSTLTIRWRQHRLKKRLEADEATHAEATAIVVPEPLTMRAKWRFAVPVGATTALDIATSNLSLLFVTVSFYTVVKSSTIAWVLIWATALGLEACRPRTVGIVVAIVAGLVLATEGERHQALGFSVGGAALVMSAACLGGVRWCLTQALFAHDAACAGDPVVVIYHVTPAGVFTLLPVALVLEARRLAFWATTVAPLDLAGAAFFAAVAGCLAYLMLLVEVQLLRETSSLGLSVGGALKDVSQVALAACTFGDEVTPQGAGGLALVLAASLAFALSRGASKASAASASFKPRYAVVGTADLDDGGCFDDNELMDDDLNDNAL